MQYLALAIALSALALGGFAVLRAAPPPEPAATPQPEPDEARLRALEARLRDLEERQPMQLPEAVLRRFDRSAPNAPERRAEDTAVLGDEDRLPAMDPILRDQVERLVRQVRRDNHEERRARRLDRFKERLLAKLNDHPKTEQLEPETQTALVDLLRDERQGFHDLMRKVWHGEQSREQARAAAKALRQATIVQVREDLGDELAGLIDTISPMPRRGPLRPPPKRQVVDDEAEH
jgi:hypothetical protein